SFPIESARKGARCFREKARRWLPLAPVVATTGAASNRRPPGCQFSGSCGGGHHPPPRGPGVPQQVTHDNSQKKGALGFNQKNSKTRNKGSCDVTPKKPQYRLPAAGRTGKAIGAQTRFRRHTQRVQ